MQFLKLNKERYEEARKGVKKASSRLDYRPIHLGKLALVMTEDRDEFFHVDVIEVRHCFFKDIDEREAKLEGYASIEEMKETLKRIYGNELKDNDEFTFIHWK